MLSAVAIEAGTHQLSDGTRVEAGRVDADWIGTTVSFTQPFAEAPVVFAQVQTSNGGDPVVVQVQDVTASGFAVRVQEEEAGGSHTTEAIGNVAIEKGAGAAGGTLFEAGVTGTEVEGASGGAPLWHTVALEQPLQETSVTLASMQSYNGSDPAGAAEGKGAGGILERDAAERGGRWAVPGKWRPAVPPGLDSGGPLSVPVSGIRSREHRGDKALPRGLTQREASGRGGA